MPFFELNPEELDILNTPVKGSGGFQGFILRLQHNVMDDGRIYVNADDIDQIKKHVNSHGQGGFQDRLRKAFQAHINFDE